LNGRLFQSGCIRGARIPVLFATLLVVPTSCAERAKDRMTQQRIPMNAVPRTVMDAAQKELPDVEFSEVWKNTDKEKKLHSYEMRGRMRSTGKICDTRVSPSGEILETD
jgi:hypothetical protein